MMIRLKHIAGGVIGTCILIFTVMLTWTKMANIPTLLRVSVRQPDDIIVELHLDHERTNSTRYDSNKVLSYATF